MGFCVVPQNSPKNWDRPLNEEERKRLALLEPSTEVLQGIARLQKMQVWSLRIDMVLGIDASVLPIVWQAVMTLAQTFLKLRVPLGQTAEAKGLWPHTCACF